MLFLAGSIIPASCIARTRGNSSRVSRTIAGGGLPDRRKCHSAPQASRLNLPHRHAQPEESPHVQAPCRQGAPHVLTTVRPTSPVSMCSLPLGGVSLSHRPAALHVFHQPSCSRG